MAVCPTCNGTGQAGGQQMNEYSGAPGQQSMGAAPGGNSGGFGQSGGFGMGQLSAALRGGFGGGVPASFMGAGGGGQFGQVSPFSQMLGAMSGAGGGFGQLGQQLGAMSGAGGGFGQLGQQGMGGFQGQMTGAVPGSLGSMPGAMGGLGQMAGQMTGAVPNQPGRLARSRDAMQAARQAGNMDRYNEIFQNRQGVKQRRQQRAQGLM